MWCCTTARLLMTTPEHSFFIAERLVTNPCETRPIDRCRNTRHLASSAGVVRDAEANGCVDTYRQEVS